MKLPYSFCAAALLAAFLGCGSSKPDTTPAKTEPKKTEEGPSAANGSKETTSPSTTPKEVPPAETKPKVVQGPPEPPKKVSDEIRTLAARLVEKSPQGSWRSNEAASLKLETLGDGAQKDLVVLLSDAKPEVRRGAAYYLLGKFDPEDAQQVAGYTALLDDQEPFLRGLGLQAVRKMQRADQAAAVPRLAKMLSAEQEPSDENRAAVARALGNWKETAEDVLVALVTAGAKEDKSPKVRGAYLISISQIAPPPVALAVFGNGLSDPDATVRLVAAARLRQLKKEAAPAAEALAQAREDPDARVREAAAEALAELGSAAVQPLIKHVDSQKAPTRQLAIACLGKLGADAKSALPRVEKHLTDEDPEVKKVAEAVVRILQGSKPN